MDVRCLKVNLHPQASDFLFQHYRTLSRIFNDVLGLLEIDYIGIALINPQDELMFLSSKPSLEFNLIENNLWPFDASYHEHFYLNNKAEWWEDLYDIEKWKSLHFFKQSNSGLNIGISIPDTFNEFRVIYSFALKSSNETFKRNLLNKIQELIRIGRFCLQKIVRAVPLPNHQMLTAKKTALKLVVNNEENHAKHT